MIELPITGGCYCGAIRYRIDKAPLSSAICYCANCRRALGSHSSSWITVESESFAFVQGNPSRFRTDTSAWRTFCPVCGTSLTYQNDRQEQRHQIDITIGSLDQPELFPPTQHSWEEERLPWEPSIELPGPPASSTP